MSTLFVQQGIASHLRNDGSVLCPCVIVIRTVVHTVLTKIFQSPSFRYLICRNFKSSFPFYETSRSIIISFTKYHFNNTSEDCI
jgi:hypothetical protein